MKGPKELKLYVSRYRDELKRGHWDDLVIFKLERCKKWFNRDKTKRSTKREINENLYTS